MTRHVAKKRFGQNFLNDEYIINQIIKIIHPTKADKIIEVGPGLGALTGLLLSHSPTLEVVEIDWDLINILEKKFANTLIIHNADALKFDYSFNGAAIKVVGNLPYNISTPLLFHLAQFDNIQDMYFMLQKEVVERICAKPNTKDYGRLSVMLQYKFSCSKMLDVSAECFNPKPKVASAIVRLKPLPQNLRYNIDRQLLDKVVSKAFNQRRKTINNSLKNIIHQDIFIDLGINPNLRAENLSIQNFVDLALKSATGETYAN